MRLIKEFPELNAITVVKKHIPIRACQMVLPFEVDTLEGRMYGKAGDYLMEGIDKELYICDKSIFERTYTTDVVQYKNPAVTVDIVVQIGFDSVVLIKRKNNPFKGKWALPGGYINYGQETLDEAAMRELKEETNLDHISLNYICAFSHPNRDPRGHTITHVYHANVGTHCIKNMKAKDDAIEIKLFDLDKLPKLAFDHYDIIYSILYTKRY